MTPPCTCGSRRSVAQHCRHLLVDVRAALDEGTVPPVADVVAERFICAALALGSAALGRFVLAAKGDDALWLFESEDNLRRLGATPYDVHIVAVCRAWVHWSNTLRSAEIVGKKRGRKAGLAAAAEVRLRMPVAWFDHEESCVHSARGAS